MEKELREKLAAYAHEAWAGWMRYLFSKGMSTIQADDNGKTVTFWTMEPALYERWQRQMNTPYADLPESEKHSDRKEADEILALLLSPRDDEANMQQMMVEIRQAVGRCAVESVSGEPWGLGDGLWVCKYGGSGSSWHGAPAYSPEQAVLMAWQRTRLQQEATLDDD